MIYLDNAATTETSPEVIEAMQPFLGPEYGNASSIHAMGRKARVELENAREVIARFLHAEPREIIFTSGGTESNNAAIKGSIFHHDLHGLHFDEMQIVTSPVEHDSILAPCDFFKRLGVFVDYLPLDLDGHVVSSSLRSFLNTKSTLLSLMLVNNETGGISDIKAIAEEARATRSDILIHTDAVQGLGKLPMDFSDLPVDLASFAAHKIHGPKGIGALYVRSGKSIEPFVHGGAQERNRRGGTEPVALAVGFAKAVELAAARMHAENAHVEKLGKQLRASLEAIPGIVVNSPSKNWLPSIVNFTFAPVFLSKIDGEAVIMRFDLEGIAVSNGAACTSGSMQPSHVLLAMGKGVEVAGKSVRVSLSHQTTEEEIEQFLAVLKRIMPR